MLVDVMVRATIILLAALAATMAMNRAAAATRHLVWTLAVVSVLALPLATTLLPAWQILPGDAIHSFVVEQELQTSSRAAGGHPQSSSADQTAANVSPTSGAKPVFKFGVGVSLLAVWAVFACVLLARIAIGIGSVRGIAQRAVPADRRWRALLHEALSAPGKRSSIRLLVSDEIAMPMTWGGSRSLLLLPLEARGWSDERARVVLLHEIAHIHRGDWFTHTIARVVAAIHWFNPLAWIAVRAMTREREHACDDYVLARGARATDYAGHLLEIATARHQPRAHLLAPAMARRSELEGRLVSILTPHRLQSRRFAAPVMTLAAVIVAAAISTAAQEAQPAPPTPVATQSTSAKPSSHPSVLLEARTADDGDEARAQRESVQTLANGLGDQSPHVREQSALALAMTEGSGAIEPLIQALNDPDEEVREEAALGLGFRPESSVVGPLLSALKDPSSQVREKAAIGLGLRRMPEVTDALLAAVTDPDSQVREKVVMALGLSGDKRATEAIVAATKDPDRQVREKAITALTVVNASSPELQEAIRAGVSSAIRLFSDRIQRH